MQMFHIDSKLQSLSAKLATDINSKCRCDFNFKYIVFDHSLCLPNHPDWFITSGVIVRTNTFNSTDIIELLQMWVEAESQVLVEGIILTAVKDCSVYLEEGKPIFCERLPDISLSSTPVQETSTPVQGTSTPMQGTGSTPVQGSTELYIIFAAIVFVLVLVLVGVLCVVTVTVLRKKIHRKHSRYIQDTYSDHSNVYETAPERNVQNALNNHEPPSQYTTLQPIQTGSQRSQEASGNNSSHYQQLLMDSLETPATYSVPQKSDVSITVKEGETLRDD